ADELPPAEICDAGEGRAGLAGSTAILVLGMHRSGTSALTGMLRCLGVALGHDLMPATADNPRGYWEHAGIVAIHQQAMGAHGMAWDDIRAMPPELAHDRGMADRIAEILSAEFAGSPLWAVKDPRLSRLLPLWR